MLRDLGLPRDNRSPAWSVHCCAHRCLNCAIVSCNGLRGGTASEAVRREAPNASNTARIAVQMIRLAGSGWLGGVQVREAIREKRTPRSAASASPPHAAAAGNSKAMPKMRGERQPRPGDGVTNRADAATAAGLDDRVRNQTVGTAQRVPRADCQRLAPTADPGSTTRASSGSDWARRFRTRAADAARAATVRSTNS